MTLPPEYQIGNLAHYTLIRRVRSCSRSHSGRRTSTNDRRIGARTNALDSRAPPSLYLALRLILYLPLRCRCLRPECRCGWRKLDRRAEDRGPGIGSLSRRRRGGGIRLGIDGHGVGGEGVRETHAAPIAGMEMPENNISLSRVLCY
jgi:hypothetical protein